MREIEAATGRTGQRFLIAKGGNDTELNAAFRSFVQQRVGAMLVAANVYFDTQREKIIAFAAQQLASAMYQLREYAVAGGLISYGPRITDYIIRPASTSGASSKARSLPICRSCNRQDSS